MQRVSLLSVNVGQPAVIGDYRGHPVTSAIGKRPVTAEFLELDNVNLAGDRQADLNVHGGPDKAVYAYPSEHTRDWAAELRQDLGPASFGENLTTEGPAEDTVCVGDVWSWGEALLQVSQPREPCYKLATFRHRPDLPKKLVAKGWTGWYFRVLRPGRVPVAGPLEIVERHPAGITILSVHQARILGLGTHDSWRAMVELPELTASWREHLEAMLAGAPARGV